MNCSVLGSCAYCSAPESFSGFDPKYRVQVPGATLFPLGTWTFPVDVNVKLFPFPSPL